jgi:hypothetical protein
MRRAPLWLFTAAFAAHVADEAPGFARLATALAAGAAIHAAAVAQQLSSVEFTRVRFAKGDDVGAANRDSQSHEERRGDAGRPAAR